MIGAVLGDIIGSRHEFNNIKTKNFPLFSEKSKMTDAELEKEFKLLFEDDNIRVFSNSFCNILQK